MPEYPKDFYLKLYREMLRIRLFEEALVAPILSGEIKTPCHLYTGQEAIAVGVCQALSEEDHVYGNHRSHGHYLAKGGDMNALAAEIWGKKTGCSRGKGGSMHIVDMDCGFMGATPIIAGTVSIAVGDALAAKIRGEDRIVVSFFGDGAMGEGVVYESINFAVLHNLPIIFVCENNHYATHMPIEKHLANVDIHQQVSGFGCNATFLNGNDVITVYEYIMVASFHCRNDEGPYFIEMETYRLHGHVGPDDNILGKHGDIRPEKEVEEWKSCDPIKLFKKYLMNLKDHDFMTEWSFMDISELDIGGIEAEKEVNEAIRFARESEWPDPEETWEGVYKERDA